MKVKVYTEEREPEQKSIVSFTMPAKEKAAFQKACEEHGFSASQVLRAICAYYSKYKSDKTAGTMRDIDWQARELEAKKDAKLTIAVNPRTWREFTRKAEDKRMKPIGLVRSLIIGWTKRPKRIRCWGFKKGTAIQIYLTKEYCDLFHELCDSEEINMPMWSVVDGLIHQWMLVQRRKENNWNMSLRGV